MEWWNASGPEKDSWNFSSIRLELLKSGTDCSRFGLLKSGPYCSQLSGWASVPWHLKMKWFRSIRLTVCPCEYGCLWPIVCRWAQPRLGWRRAQLRDRDGTKSLLSVLRLPLAGLLWKHQPAGMEKWIHNRWLNHACNQLEVQLGAGNL